MIGLVLGVFLVDVVVVLELGVFVGLAVGVIEWEVVIACDNCVTTGNEVSNDVPMALRIIGGSAIEGTVLSGSDEGELTSLFIESGS